MMWTIEVQVQDTCAGGVVHDSGAGLGYVALAALAVMAALAALAVRAALAAKNCWN